MAYTVLDLRENLVSFDLLLELEKVVGHRLKLEDVAQATLGVGKIADGLDAIKWWREGKVLEIAKYCCFDVKVTRLVHEYGVKNKEVLYRDRVGRTQRIAVDWRT
jgi:DEAD/DEAH box helicase domain-containing protein